MKKKIIIGVSILLALVMILAVGIYLRNSYAPADSDAAVGSNWWNSDWEYRTKITVGANNNARKDKPVETAINFTQILSSLGKTGTFDPNSIRVIEVDSNGAVLDNNVTFQFDRDSDYNANNKAKGNLVFSLKGNTAATASRYYHVYFDLNGENFTLPAFTEQVRTTDNVDHKGYSSIRLETTNGEYFYHKPGGGFATLIDSDDKDWIGWNSANAAAGDFRGIPNMVHPNDGGFFHPGRNIVTTTLISKGPLKATFESTSNGGDWKTLWEVYPNYAQMSVTKAPSTKYWFLYEGTPGGTLEVNLDRMTRSDESSILASGTWTTDIPNEEWVYASDGTQTRSLYLIHHQDDEEVDGYVDQSDAMTVFGFGRSGNTRNLTGLDHKFTFGLVNSKTFNQVKETVYNDYKDLSVSIGVAEEAPETTPGVSPSATTIPSDTPVLSITPTTTPNLSTTPTTTPNLSATPTATVRFTPTPTTTSAATPTPTSGVTPVTTVTPTATLTVVSSPTYSPNACGKADSDSDGNFDIVDFVSFAAAYQDGKRTCDDMTANYGECGGRDVDKNGKLNIADFGGTNGFASRYLPKLSCKL